MSDEKTHKHRHTHTHTHTYTHSESRNAAIENTLMLLRIKLISIIKQQWQIRGWLAFFLWPLSFLTLGYIWINSRLYKARIRLSTRFNKPIVIVVGNVVVGGAGKTPVVIELIKYLNASGRIVGVISRGYGRTVSGGGNLHQETLEVTQNSPSSLVGDEPKLIQHLTGVPVFVGDKRTLTARALIEKYPNTDIIISDDGLQHNALGRDINIIVFDNSGLGNGLLLPAGPLREPWPLMYSNAKTQIVLSTNQGNAPEGYKVSRSLSDFAINKYGEKLDLRESISMRIHALAGIARPEVFFEMLVDKGLSLSETTLLEDHATFNEKAFNLYEGASQTGGEIDTVFLCTEKDAIKIWEFNPNVWAVPLICSLDAKFTDEIEEALVQLAL